jgi:hypothetical protein
VLRLCPASRTSSTPTSAAWQHRARQRATCLLGQNVLPPHNAMCMRSTHEVHHTDSCRGVCAVLCCCRCCILLWRPCTTQECGLNHHAGTSCMYSGVCRACTGVRHALVPSWVTPIWVGSSCCPAQRTMSTSPAGHLYAFALCCAGHAVGGASFLHDFPFLVISRLNLATNW